MIVLGTVVDTDALLETVAASLIAGVGITIVFSLAILGAARWAEARRDGRTLAASAAGTLAVIALAASLSAVVVGILVMTSK
jgi:hypothetical protein